MLKMFNFVFSKFYLLNSNTYVQSSLATRNLLGLHYISQMYDRLLF